MPPKRKWERAVIQVSLPYMIQVANGLDPLAILPDADVPRGGVWGTLYDAKIELDGLTRHSLYAPYLRTSFALGHELLQLLEAEIDQDLGTDHTISRWVLRRIKDKWKNYR